MARPTTRSGYMAAARLRVHSYLGEHRAAVRAELITHLAEYYYSRADNPDHFNIDPHLAGPAISDMLARRELFEQNERSRGGRRVATLCLSPANRSTVEAIINPPRPTTAQQRAAASKRLLYTRYLSWTSGSASRPGTAGPAAEQAVRAALTGAAGLGPLSPGFGPVARIADLQLPGPLDSGAAVTTSPISAPVFALIEVKNVRDWLYPNGQEPWQLLSKALHVSVHRPTWRIVPVLICRRAHSSLYWMAQTLGFLVRETRSSPMGPILQPDLDTVRLGLSFSDLRIGNDPPPGLTRWMHNTLPHEAEASSARWAETVADPRRHHLLAALAATRGNPARASRELALGQLDSVCRDLGLRGWTRTRLGEDESVGPTPAD